LQGSSTRPNKAGFGGTKLLIMENETLPAAPATLQMLPLAQMKSWYNDFVEFSKSILKKDLDFGVIPGTPKPSLYKPGAEKLRVVYGLGVEMETIAEVTDLDRPFVDYTYKATVKSKAGQILAQCEGSCNSMEPKFGFLWKTISELPEGTDISKLPSKTTGKKMFEFSFAIEKAETTGQYGKPAEYWKEWQEAVNSGEAKKTKKKTKSGKEMEGYELDNAVTVYRILNPDVVGVKNTIMKMAQKRAFVGAILLATGASEFFTQDIEDMDMGAGVYSDHNTTPFEEAEVIEEKKEPVIEGHWYARLEKCKTKSDLDKLAIKHKDEISSRPELRTLFGTSKAKLPE